MNATAMWTSNGAQPARRARLVLAAIAITALAPSLAGCKSESAPYVAAPLPVRAASVTLSARTDTRSYTGTIKPRYESDLGFRVGGKIVERLANIGDLVTPGMTLARLDGHDYRLSLESAEAELTAAQSSLKQAQAE